MNSSEKMTHARIQKIVCEWISDVSETVGFASRRRLRWVGGFCREDDSRTERDDRDISVIWSRLGLTTLYLSSYIPPPTSLHTSSLYPVISLPLAKPTFVTPCSARRSPISQDVVVEDLPTTPFELAQRHQLRSHLRYILIVTQPPRL
jgi:hypothetical protein